MEQSFLRLRTISQLVLLAAIATGVHVGCAAPPPVLTQLMEARRLASDLRVEFGKASEASNRAVMADTDEVSAAAAAEARRAREIVDKDATTLQATLQALGYRDDLRHLEEFKDRFEEYLRLDDEILPLAVENTNLKAQRLSFGPAREAADTFRAAVDAAARSIPAKDSSRARQLAAAAEIPVLEILALQAPHIAGPQDDVMTRFETQMKASAATARKALGDLQALGGPAAASPVANATTALDQFMSVNGQIVALSRRNTNVRSLALAMGRKRTVTAEVEARLMELEELVAKYELRGTR